MIVQVSGVDIHFTHPKISSIISGLCLFGQIQPITTLIACVNKCIERPIDASSNNVTK